ncbi:PREDICTED: uncharacterized protein LOC106125996 isoform X4 [Papilio xuthus]|uniref:Uncharacterized protein LOC106125996 isoform X4 n=1 Tax=Papilio xuthus TaxID=66420 RepID=A0AAJ6ZTC7_PAPXU|nr:PREDICTED: uncharacterized protein LOC106125996 isoform X4 [Papilio xuthus]
MIKVLTIVLLGWLYVQSTESFGISSFGKANTETPKPVTPTPLPARPCSRQADCAGISSSSCVRTHYDSVTRCLCGDNSPPLNGQCEAQSKLLYHVCANSDECNDGLVCGAPNITGNAQPHLRVLTPQDKICLCDTESGYREREYTCSDAEILKTSIFAIIFVTSLRKIVFY